MRVGEREKFLLRFHSHSSETASQSEEERSPISLKDVQLGRFVCRHNSEERKKMLLVFIADFYLIVGTRSLGQRKSSVHILYSLSFRLVVFQCVSKFFGEKGELEGGAVAYKKILFVAQVNVYT